MLLISNLLFADFIKSDERLIGFIFNVFLELFVVVFDSMLSCRVRRLGENFSTIRVLVKGLCDRFMLVGRLSLYLLFFGIYS